MDNVNILNNVLRVICWIFSMELKKKNKTVVKNELKILVKTTYIKT